MRFTPLKLGVLDALWKLDYLNRGDTQSAPPQKHPTPFSRDEALRLFPLGALVEKPHGGRAFLEQVYYYSSEVLL